MSGHYLKHHPDPRGWYGDYGGAFLPPELEAPFAEIAAAYQRAALSGESILVNLSGRGDKDIDYVAENFGYGD